MSRQWRDAAAAVALALWVGGGWAVGYLVAPALFAVVPDRALAGEVAGALFTRMGYVGAVCALVILATEFSVAAGRPRAVWHSRTVWCVAFMLACTVFNLWVAQPTIAEIKAAGWSQQHSAGADRFAVWHALSASVYLLQSVAGAAALIVWTRRSGHGRA